MVAHPAEVSPKDFFFSVLKVSPVNADTDRKVRATRAYLAGFGTSGSLLAGAALMFVLASAIVAFHGWPQIGDQTSVPNVAAPRVALASSSPTGRILQAALSSRVRLAGLPGAGPQIGNGAGGGGSTGDRAGSSDSAAGPGTGSATGKGTTSGSRPSSPCVQPVCASSIPTAVPVDGLTGTAGSVVSQSGAQAGSTLSDASGAASGAVSGVSPPVGGTLNQAGGSAGGTVTTVSSTVAGAVSHVGHIATGLTH